MDRPSRRLRIGTAILAVGSLGIGGVSLALVSHGLDLGTRTGRHLLAGALANGSLAILLVVLALVPLRHGARWAFWAYLVPLVGYGIPIFIVDAMHVVPERLLMTLLPQAVGLAAALVGLTLVAQALFAKDTPT